MAIKVKDEKILAQKHELKILEKKLQTKLSEMSHQRHTIEETEVTGKKMLEGHQYELERRELELKRINRLQQEKDDEIRQMSERFESKLTKRQKRADEQIEKLNQVVTQQLKEIQSYKGVMADKDRSITDLEKQVLLQPSSDGSNKNTYTGKEFDDLGDQIRTKEEEIQILWNVIKEINKTKGNAVNIGQLQKLIIRSDANLMANSKENQASSIYATPNPPRY